MTFNVERDPVPVGLLGNASTTLTVVGGGTLYYADNSQVSPTSNQGSLTSGNSATFTENVWIVSASTSSVSQSFTAASGASSGASSVSAWQFPVRGAQGDGKVIADAAITISLAVLTSATANFTSADVGKAILVAGAGDAAGNSTLVSTISGFTNATTVTLANTAAATVSSAYAVYGTDDTAAINATVTAATTYAQANGYYAEIMFDDKVYMIAGAPTQGGATKGNAQIPLPFVPMSGRKLTLAFRGCRDNLGTSYGPNSTPQLSGTVLACARSDGTNSASFGPATVIGGPTSQGGGGTGANYNNIRPLFDGIHIAVPYNSTYCGFDFWGCATFTVKSSSVAAFASPTQMANAGNILVARRYTFGLRTTALANDGNARIDQFQAEGVWAGLMIGEHVYMASGVFFYCSYGILGYSDALGTPMVHASRIAYACSEGNSIGQLGFQDANIRLDVDTLDVDTSAPAVYDPNNVGRGTVTVRGAGGGENPFVVNGAGYMRIVNGDQVPGTGSFAAQPAMPATATAFKNPYYRDALIYITGGTVSSIQISGTPAGIVTLGLTSGLVELPPGMSITINYTVAPTWFWMIK